MISLFQFFDPTAFGPYAAVSVAIYLMMDRRIRRIEGQMNRLIGRLETEEEREK